MVYLLGVAGDSGTGKTSFYRTLSTLFPRVSHISLDDYHLYGREERKRLRITPLDPRANDFDLMAEHLAAIKRGEPVVKPIYDHSRGIIVRDAERFVPTDVVVVEGLLPFYRQDIADLFDAKVFFDVSAPVRMRWKLERDRKLRGYVRQFDLSERKRDYHRYVLPQRDRCDAVFRVERSHRFRRRISTAVKYRERFLMEYPISINLDTVLARGVLEVEGTCIRFDGSFSREVLSDVLRVDLSRFPGFLNAFTAAQVVFGVQTVGRWLHEV